MNLSKIAIAVIMTLTAAAGAGAAPAKVTASIDSTVVEMGSRATITVNVADASKSGTPVDFPKPGSSNGDIDIISVDVDTLPAGYRYNMLVQAFVPGMATIPPFRYAVGSDTAESDVLTLKVLPVELDSLETINPMESIVEAPSRWYDWIPDWTAWVVLAAALLVLAFCLWRVYRKNGTLIVHHVKPVDPYEEAMSALERLRQQRLAESGHEKEFYTHLVDILRVYLERRFKVNAMEMSSTQIVDSLRSNPETRGNHMRIKQILEIADFVKFAKVRPMPDDNIKTFNNVVNFVEETRPRPAEETQADGTAAPAATTTDNVNKKK